MPKASQFQLCINFVNDSNWLTQSDIVRFSKFKFHKKADKNSFLNKYKRHIFCDSQMPDFFTKNLATEAEPDILKNLALAELYGVR